MEEWQGGWVHGQAVGGWMDGYVDEWKGGGTGRKTDRWING